MTGDETWRVSRLGRGSCWAVVCSGVLGLVLTVLAAITEEDLEGVDVAASAVTFSVMALAGWRLGLHPALTATPSHLIIRNPVRRWSLPWAEVMQASPARNGIRIELRGGGHVTAWAVQTGTLRRTRGREVSSLLNAPSGRGGEDAGKSPPRGGEAAQLGGSIDRLTTRLAGRSEWTGMEPHRRRRWAMVLTLETIVVCLVFGWFLSEAFDDPDAWMIMGVFGASFTAFVWGLAFDVKATLKWALVLTPLIFWVLPVVLAYLSRND